MCATLFVQPLDLVKNRMQLSGISGKREYRSSVHCLTSIVRNEGLLAIYNGLSAGLLRQATYTTTRLGTYTYLFEYFRKGDTAPSFAMKFSLGMVAGATGSVVGTPAELALIRMTSDGRLPPEQRRNYKNVFDALIRVVKEEGVLTLWRGCGPTVIRGVVVNASQLSTYSQSKQALLGTGYVKDGIFCHFLASMVSGLATTIASMPVDIAKTRIQSMKVIDGKPEYRNAFDVWIRVIRNEGIFALWKGFTPYYMRIGPHTVITFIFLEQMNAAYYKYVLGVRARPGAYGQRKIGPFNIEKFKWPGQNREFPELSPKWHKENPKELHRYTGVQEEGYIDPVTGNHVVVPEMQSKLVVPNLDGFKLKPYVSFRTDVEIEKRIKSYEAKVKEKGSQALADLHTIEDERWPPPKMDVETLFELCYGDQIRQAFKDGKYGVSKMDNVDSV
ncbi:hypothetical protein DICVIV_02546 [Dictyocaulus viviparus]|uniref:Mitochondrial 2-oxoglutarate/malate carrier protein n=1 Tax=Dictyocaulus viviparus TaxID=29172 RepID=A0A0D8Y517_DICVI|nr:hypothetical protein DICVIV_02546 [Dictyocaulus viviparus]